MVAFHVAECLKAPSHDTVTCVGIVQKVGKLFSFLKDKLRKHVNPSSVAISPVTLSLTLFFFFTVEEIQYPQEFKKDFI